MLNFKPEKIGFEEDFDGTWILQKNNTIHKISFLDNSILYHWKKIGGNSGFNPSSKSFYKNDPCSVRQFLIEIGIIDFQTHREKIYHDSDFDCFDTV